MIPSKLTVGELNNFDTKLTASQLSRLRWGRFQEQKDRLGECRSRVDVAKLGGFDTDTREGRARGSSWVNNMIMNDVLAEVRVNGRHDNCSYHLTGKLPSSVSGTVLARRKKKTRRVVEKVVEKPAITPVKPVEKTKEVNNQNTIKARVLVMGRRKVKASIAVEFEGVSQAWAESAIEALINKTK